MGIRAFFKKLNISSRKERCGIRFPYFCKVHGVCGKDRQGALAQSRAGDCLQIVHCAEKEYSSYIYVYSLEINRILGILDKKLTDKLLYVFGKGFSLDGKIERITGGKPKYEYFGCNIRIADTSKLLLKKGKQKAYALCADAFFPGNPADENADFSDADGNSETTIF